MESVQWAERITAVAEEEAGTHGAPCAGLEGRLSGALPSGPCTLSR